MVRYKRGVSMTGKVYWDAEDEVALIPGLRRRCDSDLQGAIDRCQSSTARAQGADPSAARHACRLCQYWVTRYCPKVAASEGFTLSRRSRENVKSGSTKDRTPPAPYKDLHDDVYAAYSVLPPPQTIEQHLIMRDETDP